MQHAPVEEVSPRSSRSIVLRNALLLFAAQLVATPFAVVVHAVMARYIGPAEFGRLYLASTFCAFGFLAVDWGQNLTLPGMVARDRTRSGELLGTGLAWRALAAVVVSALLSAGSLVLGYGSEFVIMLLLVALGLTFSALSNACQETIRGFERADVTAYAQAGGQLLMGAAAIAILVVGGSLHTVLLGQALCGLLVLFFVWRALRGVGVGKPTFRGQTLRELVVSGVPFLLFGLAMALQPNIDALFLSKMVPDEVVGWHAVARRLIGVLVFPATAIVGALYPTLCRLYATDQGSYARTASNAIRTTTMLAVPLALGCYAYPDIGVQIFSRASYAPAEDNLRVLSPFLFLLYFSMPLGCAVLAAGKQRAWSFAQIACVVFSSALNPFLIRWFQERNANGGLGVCIAGLVSETIMVGFGIWLTPARIFDRALFAQIGRVLVAGGAMFGTSLVLRSISPWAAAPVALLSYGLCLWLVGGIDPKQLAQVRGMVGRRLARFRGGSSPS